MRTDDAALEGAQRKNEQRRQYQVVHALLIQSRVSICRQAQSAAHQRDGLALVEVFRDLARGEADDGAGAHDDAIGDAERGQDAAVLARAVRHEVILGQRELDARGRCERRGHLHRNQQRLNKGANFSFDSKAQDKS